MLQEQILIPLVLVVLALSLIWMDRNKGLKERHVAWVSRHIFRDNSGKNTSAARLYQSILGFLFIFCVGIGTLFIIGLFEN